MLASGAPQSDAALQVEGKLLAGRAAVITGAARERSLGRRMAELFAEHGCRCALLDLPANDQRPSAQKVAEQIGPEHIGIDCDVSDASACRQAVDEAAAAFGRLDAVVNNAGFVLPHMFGEIRQSDMDRIMQTHVHGSLFIMQAAAPHMRAAGGGSIVNMSSLSALRGGGFYGGPHYTAAKAAIVGITRSAARELAPDRIRVNALAPSMIDTNIHSGRVAPELRKRFTDMVPMGRLGTTDDVAAPALFLASDLAAGVTGAVLCIAGGSHIG